MASFRNSRMIMLVAGLGILGANAADGDAAKPEATAPAEEKKPDVAKEKKRLDLPIPKGQPQKGLRIPIYSPEGKLTMSFQIGIGELVDADHVKLSVLHLETFKENGEHDFDVDLPDSIFNAETKELTSKVHGTVKCREFEITGNSVAFNLGTKSGKFGDGVKMTIYDVNTAFSEEKNESKTPGAEPSPVQEEKK